MKAATKKINLLPAAYSREQQSRIYKYIGVGALVVECIVFVIGVVILPRIKLTKQQAVLDALQITLNDAKYEEVDEMMHLLEAAQGDLKLWTEKYNALKKPDFISERILDSLTASVPKGVVIQSLSLSADEGMLGGTIDLAGVAPSYNAVLSYVATLESKYGSDYVSFTADKEEKEKTSYYNYTIAINSLGEDTASQMLAEEKMDETLEEDETW